MILALGPFNPRVIDGYTRIDLHCVSCTRYVGNEDAAILGWLAGRGEAVLCFECEGVGLDETISLSRAHVVACLLGHNSTNNAR